MTRFFRRSMPRPAVALAASLGAMVFLGGCQDPLFRAEEPRSQYDRFDAVREQRAPSFVMDEFGRKRPNVRSRLLVFE